MFAGGISTSTIYGGSDSDSLSINGVVSGTTIYGEAGSDSIFFGSTISTSRILGGADSDSISFSTYVTNSSIAGGAGDDTFVFGHSGQTLGAANTYFFGSDDGSDTLIFSNGTSSAGDNGMVFAFGGAANTGTSVITVTTGSAASTISYDGSTIYLQGFSGSGGSGAGDLGLQFITVTDAAITSLG